MTSFGSPDQWVDFIETQVPDILTLVIGTWETMPPPLGNELEDVVSEALCRALRQSRTRCELPFRIDSQLVELDPAAGQDQGRMDIVFSPTCPEESIYFALECKRLHVRNRSGVRPCYSEYVRHGMFRFVNRQYANAVPYGGMLAFILDGDISRAIDGVESNIRANLSNLEMDAPGGFQPSSGYSEDDRVKETRHRRNGQEFSFVIQHLFMAGDPNTPLRSEAPLNTETCKRKKPAKRSGQKRSAL